MTIPYKHTDVSTDKTQGHIRGLLKKYGAIGVQFTDEFVENTVQMRFRYELNGDTGKVVYFVRMEAHIPKPKPMRNLLRGSHTAMDKKYDQAMRATWRAIYWALKSRMESIQYGIETFEQAFLAHFEAGIDETGRAVTIGERLIPRLRAGQLALPPGKGEEGKR